MGPAYLYILAYLHREGLPHGLKPALDELRGAESEGGPKGGQETTHTVQCNA